MARKCVVKVGLSREQKDISLELVRRFGTSESEMLRTALMDYAKDAYLVRERMYRKQVAMVEN